MNLFDQLSLDQLHTLATSLGNTIRRLQELHDNDPRYTMQNYYCRCANDASQLLLQVNAAFEEYDDTAELIGQMGLDE